MRAEKLFKKIANFKKEKKIQVKKYYIFEAMEYWSKYVSENTYTIETIENLCLNLNLFSNNKTTIEELINIHPKNIVNAVSSISTSSDVNTLLDVYKQFKRWIKSEFELTENQLSLTTSSFKKTLTKQEFDKLLFAIKLKSYRDWLLLRVMYENKKRLTETINLEIKHIKKNHYSISLFEDLNKYIDETNHLRPKRNVFVFLTSKGKTINRLYFNRKLNRSCLSIGIKQTSPDYIRFI